MLKEYDNEIIKLKVKYSIFYLESMKIPTNFTLLLLFLLSTVSILATTISLSTSIYAQENQTETKNQLPDAAKGPVIASKGYLVEEIRDSLFWVTDGAYNTIFLVTDEGVVAIDAPPTIGKDYLKAISEVTDKPITHVIYSHAHLDHIGAAKMFPTNAVIIAQEETAAELQRAKTISTNSSMVLPIPTEIFSNNYTLQIGNQTLQLDYYGDNHDPGNIFIYAPKQKVLMLVDVVFPGWVPFPYLATAKDVAGFIKAHDIALNNYDFNTFVGGHLTRLGTINDVMVQKEFISDLERAAAQANQQVSFDEIAKQVGGEQQPFIFSLAKRAEAVSENCANNMVPKWENKLGGAQKFMSAHCYTMAQAGRIDPSVQALLQNSTFASN